MNNNLMTIPKLRSITHELAARVEANGRSHPIPKLSARAIARLEAEAARQAAIAEQQREESGMQQLAAKAAAIQQVAVESS
ncbi:hypothetical protein WJX72_009479 [[Myrmecia] bisecta]|uniref:Uncharacterized protein n=1 Tax=[Myrmecia] bisecta TaxID=41462 RepID=A0AAW1QG80_9CHLO